METIGARAPKPMGFELHESKFRPLENLLYATQTKHIQGLTGPVSQRVYVIPAIDAIQLIPNARLVARVANDGANGFQDGVLRKQHLSPRYRNVGGTM